MLPIAEICIMRQAEPKGKSCNSHVLLEMLNMSIKDIKYDERHQCHNDRTPVAIQTDRSMHNDSA